MRQNVERKSAEAAKTLEFVQGQIPQVRKNVDATEAAVKEYRLKKGSVDLDIETQAILDRAVDIEKSTLRAGAEPVRAAAAVHGQPSHAALAEGKGRQAPRRAGSRWRGRCAGCRRRTLDSVRLSRDAKVASELYFLLLNKSQELNVVKSGTIGNVRVLDSALNPYEPVSPKKAPVLALSLFLGLAAGIAAAFAKKALDQGVEDPAEIEAATGVSVYASVPHSAKEVELARQRRTSTAAASVLAAVDPGDLAVESLRSLRTALQFALVDATTNVVTISGPSPGVGKSFVSANLAHVLATSGKRVLLIDGDLRRGGLHRYLGRQALARLVGGGERAVFARGGDAQERTGKSGVHRDREAAAEILPRSSGARGSAPSSRKSAESTTWC